MTDENNANNNNDSLFDYRSLLPQTYRARVNSAGSVEHSNNTDSTTTPDYAEDSWLESCCVDLSFKERMLGFGTCVIAGYMLSFGSFWRIRDLVLGDPYPLVIHTTVGNLLSFAGSFFLVGPKAQWNRMWDDSRNMATKVYLSSLALIFAIVLVHPPGPEGLYLFLLLIVQYGAMTWYCLSYIPFGQETVKNYLGKILPDLPSWGSSSAAGGGDNDLHLGAYAPAPV
eukprot:CAMPEP_0168848402 /NCGR_PEP_ID=MMETSP0727-20121128/10826_1 /TAXON_ID=265536 /ORGANISM="Amphiprora sp., Strain CCMP467" /LENGTH=226 /DNA_ID=CAMNT_0008902259 /DNA_START=204 /DNA_END=884 /DNA_ORIENTATION=-